MIDLKDKNTRHKMVNSFLEAETSLEDERLLYDFYLHAEPNDLTKEDKVIRSMLLHFSKNTEENLPMTTMLDNHNEMNLTEMTEKEHLFDQLTNVPQRTHTVRLSAIVLAAAMLIGIVFTLFLKDQPRELPITPQPNSRTFYSHNSYNTDREKAIEYEDSIFIAANKPTTQKKNVSLPPKNIKKAAISEPKEKSGNQDGMAVEQARELESIASMLYPSSEQLKIENTDDGVLLTIIDSNGNAQQYKMEMLATADAPEYQLTSLAVNETHPQ